MERKLRRLPLEGLYNARELGGFPTADGGVTAYGVFIRSELPRKLTRGDMDYLKSYGVTHSVDLRGDMEVSRLPSMLRDVDWARYSHVPMFTDQAAYASQEKDGPQNPNKHMRPPATAFIEWGQLYIEMIEKFKDWTRRVLDIAANESGIMLYHCTTGKDRTGMLTALLLSIAGVSQNDIIADYCVSQVYMRPVYLELMELMPPLNDENGKPIHPTIDSPFNQTAPENMRKLLDHLNSTYGSVINYILSCGVTQDTIDKIKAKLTE